MSEGNTHKFKSFERGYSLIEILVVLVIAGILALIAFPQAAEFQASFQRNNAANQLEADIRRARAEAISQGARGVIAVDAGTSYVFGLDTLPFSNTPAADSTMFSRELPTNITATGATTIVFDSRGYHIDSSGTLTTTTITLNYDSSSFCSGTIEATGNLELSCNG